MSGGANQRYRESQRQTKSELESPVEASADSSARNADDTAIVYDPSEQRLFRDSKSSINNLAFTEVPLSRWSNSVDIYVNIGETDTRAFVGRVNLKTLGWPVTKMRLKGEITTLYVLGKVRDGKVADEGYPSGRSG